MKTITIITPANTEVEYRLAGAGSRLAAFIIDLLIQIILISIIAAVYFLGGNRGIYGDFGGAALGIILIMVFVIHFGYFILCEMAMSGQTIGKHLFGLRAIRENGQPIEFTQSLIRGLFRTAVDMMYVGIFAILFSSQHKRLGDMAAGTIVVCENYERLTLAAPLISLSKTALPEFLAAHEDKLTEEERRIAQEWMRRKDSLPDGGAELAKKILAFIDKPR